jgi:hypothetical protein
MKIYVKNIDIKLDNLTQSKYSYNKTNIEKFFTKSGIFIINDDISKLKVIDKPIITKNEKYIVDDSEYYLQSGIYQIPFHYYKQNYEIYQFIVNPVIKLYLVIETIKSCSNKSKEKNESYFYINNPGNNLDNVLKEISTFLSSFNFC